MRDRRVASRYAEALLVAARQQDLVAPLAESFHAVALSVAQTRDLQVFLRAPQIARTAKKELLRSVLADRVEPLLVHFLDLLLDKDRITDLQEIESEFARMVETARGVQRAIVVTAVPLASDLDELLRERLQALTGKSIILEKKIDPAVIGGACVTMGDEILDGTVRTGLSRLRQQLEQTPLR